ncbi:kielin/chordin-like protein isoform X2 [Dreissena polymorpha]|nr:kielin/chordin-like protein isoform X2 [Dreissena polymorpha]
MCSAHGRTFHPGDVWVDANACDVCQCTEYGEQCNAGFLGTTCPFNSTVASPGDPACVYGYTSHLVGDVISALDGCNKCLCTELGLQCTAKACGPNGFAKPSSEPLYGECEYEGGWYMHETQWRASDGCNTCYCYTVGNYRGGHVCTTNKCACHGSAIIAG